MQKILPLLYLLIMSMVSLGKGMRPSEMYQELTISGGKVLALIKPKQM